MFMIMIYFFHLFVILKKVVTILVVLFDIQVFILTKLTKTGKRNETSESYP